MYTLLSMHICTNDVYKTQRKTKLKSVVTHKILINKRRKGIMSEIWATAKQSSEFDFTVNG